MRILFPIVFFISFQSFAQKQSLRDSLLYMSYGGELILSFSDASQSSVKTLPRLSAAIHWQALLHINIHKNFGMYTGLAMRNIGLIYKQKDTLMAGQEIKYKQRSYTLGVPVAFKIGNMNKRKFIYAGGEIEYAFAYKQKRYINNHKDIYSEWFGNQVNHWLPSVFAGFQLRSGINFKVKYYLNNFLNKEYSTTENGQYIKPFAHLSSHILYFSISTMMRKKKKKNMPPKKVQKEGIFTKHTSKHSIPTLLSS
jgi:hypothetical protein